MTRRSPHGQRIPNFNTHRSTEVHYQSGGIRPSHLRTPRLTSDGSWFESFPTTQQSSGRLGGWIKWSGWLAFVVLLFAYIK